MSTWFICQDFSCVQSFLVEKRYRKVGKRMNDRGDFKLDIKKTDIKNSMILTERSEQVALVLNTFPNKWSGKYSEAGSPYNEINISVEQYVDQKNFISQLGKCKFKKYVILWSFFHEACCTLLVPLKSNWNYSWTSCSFHRISPANFQRRFRCEKLMQIYKIKCLLINSWTFEDFEGKSLWFSPNFSVYSQ